MKRRFLPLLIAALLCLGLSALAEGNVLKFDQTAHTVFEGETLQTALIREGDFAEGEVTYTSANEKTATVDANGVVTGVAKGQVSITAAVTTEKQTVRAQLTVTVARKVTGLDVKTDQLPLRAPDDPLISPLLRADSDIPQVLMVPVRKAVNLQVTALPQDASNRRLVFRVEDESVAKVQGNGAVGVAPGETVLTVESESNPEINVQYRLLVVQPVTKLTVSSSAPSVAVGGQVSLTAQAAPDNASLPQVVWSSGDERIATVDANGVVTGLKRGNGRIIATAADGSGVRANFSIKVTQNPESVSLSSEEVTVDVGRNVSVRPTVAPNDADNKRVLWSSSDESVATVARDGRITGVAPGDCTVTCVSEELDSVSAALTVHVQQPVKKLFFTDKTAAGYAGETTQLSWITEPEDATHPGVTFSSSNPKIATVDENGAVTGVSHGNATITAVTTDGSNRKASITVKIGQHVTGVHMVRENAYINLHETATAGATLEPKDATNNHMTWVSSDESVVTATGNTNAKMKLKGIGYGDATVTGTTEDGGFQTSIHVYVGNFDRSLSFRGFDFDDDGYRFWLTVRNDSDFVITQITASLEMYDKGDPSHPPVGINARDDSNVVKIVWNGTLQPGETTGQRNWKMVDYQFPSNIMNTYGTVTLESFQIDHDWVKTIQRGNRPSMSY